ncbi:hypothetical protein JHK87_009635 [Glycine soja]|nr:hypothetical protein JHK87_009635 [Glycine soja]
MSKKKPRDFKSECPQLEKTKDKKKSFKSKTKKNLMSTWEDLRSDEEDKEETNLCLIADITSEDQIQKMKKSSLIVELRENRSSVDFTYDTKEKTKDAKENIEDVVGSMKDRVENAAEKTFDYSYDTKESAKDTTRMVADKSREGAERMKEKMEEVAVLAGETLKSLAKKAKQGVQGAWEMAVNLQD